MSQSNNNSQSSQNNTRENENDTQDIIPSNFLSNKPLKKNKSTKKRRQQKSFTIINDKNETTSNQPTFTTPTTKRRSRGLGKLRTPTHPDEQEDDDITSTEENDTDNSSSIINNLQNNLIKNNLNNINQSLNPILFPPKQTMHLFRHTGSADEARNIFPLHHSHILSSGTDVQTPSDNQSLPINKINFKRKRKVNHLIRTQGMHIQRNHKYGALIKQRPKRIPEWKRKTSMVTNKDLRYHGTISNKRRTQLKQRSLIDPNNPFNPLNQHLQQNRNALIKRINQRITQRKSNSHQPLPNNTNNTNNKPQPIALQPQNTFEISHQPSQNVPLPLQRQQPISHPPLQNVSQSLLNDKPNEERLPNWREQELASIINQVDEMEANYNKRKQQQQQRRNQIPSLQANAVINYRKFALIIKQIVISLYTTFN